MSINQIQYNCIFLQGKKQISAIIVNNSIYQIKHNQTFTLTQKSTYKKSRILLKIPKQIQFCICRTQITQNKKYKFHLQLKLKQDQNTYIIIIDGKQLLQTIIKHLSIYGMITGLQQMIVSCQKIGEGSFAEVYKVIPNYDSVMALKAFDKKALKIHKNKLAFWNQIQIMRLLNNKHIVTIDGIFQTQKKIYLKMQYFPFSLKQFIKKNISIKVQKKIMKQLFQALLQMKSKNIIHRDIKPQNIMIRGKKQQNLQCVLIDYGLSTKADADKYIFNRCGTPGFLAPEIAKMSTKKQKQTVACDMFSLGCVFFKIVSKKYIFPGNNHDQVIEKNKKFIIDWHSFHQFSENQFDLLKQMLQINPNKRITPEQALRHPYFYPQIDDQDEISLQLCDIDKKMKIMSSSINKTRHHRQSTEELMSSFHSSYRSKDSLNSQYPSRRISYKDSCVTFEGPVRVNSSNGHLEQSTMKHSKAKKRVSRFSQINQPLIL